MKKAMAMLLAIIMVFGCIGFASAKNDDTFDFYSMQTQTYRASTDSFRIYAQ